MYLLIYVITNAANGKKYVGKTTKTLEHRWKQHLNTARTRRNYPLYAAMRKYGTAQFTIEQVATAHSEAELNELEIQWIANLGTFTRERGYNVTRGGDGMSGFVHGPETKRKMAVKRTGYKFSSEVREKMRKARLGKKMPEETIRKIRSHWGEARRDYQGEVAARVNAVENAKLKDYVCDRCKKTFTQVKRGVFGGHRKACLSRKA